MESLEKTIIKRRDITYPRIEYRTGHLELILPLNADENEILEKHKHWIEEKSKLISEMLIRSENLEFEPRTKDEFIKAVKAYTEQKAKFCQKIQIRKMKSKWASCSSSGTITLNILAKDLPKHHLEYILSHEIQHITNRKHDTAFFEALSSEFPDINEIEKDLCGYWFKLNKTEQ